jgi:hypothetical protein
VDGDDSDPAASVLDEFDVVAEIGLNESPSPFQLPLEQQGVALIQTVEPTNLHKVLVHGSVMPVVKEVSVHVHVHLP